MADTSPILIWFLFLNYNSLTSSPTSRVFQPMYMFELQHRSKEWLPKVKSRLHTCSKQNVWRTGEPQPLKQGFDWQCSRDRPFSFVMNGDHVCRHEQGHLPNHHFLLVNSSPQDCETPSLRQDPHPCGIQSFQKAPTSHWKHLGIPCCLYKTLTLLLTKSEGFCSLPSVRVTKYGSHPGTWI